MRINENITMGLDLGIGSIGWVLIENSADGHAEIFTRRLASGEVLQAAGVRLVNVPEDRNTKELLSAHRREVRRQRLTIKRRARRLRDLRAWVAEHIYPQAADITAMHHAGDRQAGPWRLRAEALERKLEDREFALILTHMAKHRGFLSNSKKDAGGNRSDTGRMLTAIGQLQQRMAEERAATVGAWLARQTAQRNRGGIDGKPVYNNTVTRALVAREAEEIFAAQRRFGNSKAGEELLAEYKKLAFEQRPLRSVETLIGDCSFMAGEKRAPRFSPTAERFRLAQRLCNIRLSGEKGQSRALTAEERHLLMAVLGRQKSITYSTVRKELSLADETRFEGLAYGVSKEGRAVNPEKDDIVRRGKGGGRVHALFTELLGKELFQRLMEERAADGHRLADAISKVISDIDDKKEIEERFYALGLAPGITDALMQGVEQGKFADFSGVMHLSLKAMEAVIPAMLDSGDYAEGCRLAGFDHTMTRQADWENIKNPVVQHMVREVRRQAQTIVREFNVLPGRVHIEVARDLGKSVEERNAIEKGMKDNQKRNESLRGELAGHFGCAPEQISPSELMRYKLWTQQGGKCCYYMLWRKAGGEGAYSAKGALNGGIEVRQLRDGLNEVQIDHILPYSHTYDSSFHNLGLCLAAANQNKGNRSPYEWLGADHAQSWHEFEQWANGLAAAGLKKRNYLLKDLKARQEQFSNRNLNDTRYIVRVIMDWFRREFYVGHDPEPEEGETERPKRRVFARPGQLTAFLRKSWGLESLKKDAAGQRLGDRHHALDAFITACCSEALLQQVTKAFKRKEEELLSPTITPPMPDARRQMEQALRDVFPSRAERGGSKGAAHKDTLRAIVTEKDEKGREIKKLYKRTPISKLSIEDLPKIKDACRCPDIIEPLRRWLEQGKAKDAPPCSSATGFPIKKVKLLCTDSFSSGIEVRRGTARAQAGNRRMVRTDVFIKKGQYHMVPVYSWQIAQGILPNKAIIPKKAEEEWAVVDDSFAFLFSIYRNTYIVTDNGKEVREGYLVDMDRKNGSITLAKAYDRREHIKGLGVRTLKSFRKYRVDRLGRLHPVKKEKRPLP